MGGMNGVGGVGGVGGMGGVGGVGGVITVRTRTYCTSGISHLVTVPCYLMD